MIIYTFSSMGLQSNGHFFCDERCWQLPETANEHVTPFIRKTPMYLFESERPKIPLLMPNIIMGNPINGNK